MKHTQGKRRMKNMDPYRCIVDTGCPKAVMGRRWMDTYAESKGDKAGIRSGKENESFRFGPSDIYKSETYYEIEVEMNSLKEKISLGNRSKYSAYIRSGISDEMGDDNRSRKTRDLYKEEQR